MERQQYEMQKLVSGLMKIGHGNLVLFTDPGLQAARTDPELFAHFVAWNEVRGKVRDSKVAYPPIALRGVDRGDNELAENAVAHMVSQGPRELIKSYQHSSRLTSQGYNIPHGYRRMLESALECGPGRR